MRTLVHLPPLEEQRSIVDSLEGTLEKIDQVSAKVRRERDLMKEFKSRLIADAVTGEVDVRGAGSTTTAPTAGGGGRPEPEIDLLSNILRVFNEHFGDIPWADADRVRQLITETIPSRVAADGAFRNARRNSDEQNARIEHDRALLRVMTSVMKDDTELFKHFMDNDGFKRWMTDTVFALAYDQPVTG